MRIIKVEIIGRYKNLENFSIDLNQSSMETVLLGKNATGKSNFLEALILIYKYLDLSKVSVNEKTKHKSVSLKFPIFEYSITYQCRNFNIEVKHLKKKYTISVDNQSLKPNEFFEQANKNKYLPKYVFTYYSGISNRLREHFDDHQRNFYSSIIGDEVNREELDNLRRLFYVQSVHAYFVLMAYFSFEKDEQDSIQFLREVLSIEDLESVMFKLHDPKKKFNGTDSRFWKAKGLVQELLADVWRYSIAPIRSEEDDPNKDFRSQNVKREFLYLYISNKAKLQALAESYNSNTGFFKALESTYISDLIDEVRVKVKKRNVDGEVTFKELSEGEQQLLTVMGLLKFTKDKESLILLDEPDTHLNPLWKWQYLDLLHRVVDDEDATQIIINTHDPLVIGSLLKEQVRIFRVDSHTGQVTAARPDIDPQGLGVAGILTSELFGLPTALDQPTLDLLQERNELLYRQDHQQLDEIGQIRLQKLFMILNRKGFARIDKDPLYERFLRAYLQRTEAKLPIQQDFITKEERAAQDKIAVDILDEIFQRGTGTMIHIDTTGSAPSDEWQTKADDLTKQLQEAKTKKERDVIIDSNPHWRDTKAELMKLSYGKCWYSEAREIYSHYHVDHFRPKKKAKDTNKIDQGGYWWLTYDWTNYRLCGSVGNTKKNDYFPVKHHKANSSVDPVEDEVFYLLDPTDADDVKLLSFDAEGKAIPAYLDADSWAYIRANETINWFDLNYEALRTERQRVWTRVSALIEDIEELIQKQNINPASSTQALIKAELKKLKQLIAPCTELSATIRCCIRVTGYPWASRLLEDPINLKEYCKGYI